MGAMPIFNIEVLRLLTNHTGSTHVNALGGKHTYTHTYTHTNTHTHTHTHCTNTTDKSNFKKPAECTP